MKILSFLAIAGLMLTSCTSITSNFALTGKGYDPLPEGSQVQVLLTDNKTLDFEEIGSLQVIQSRTTDFSEVIEFVKKEARIRGGDIVRLISTNSRTQVAGNQYAVISSVENIYIFVVGKLKMNPGPTPFLVNHIRNSGHFWPGLFAGYFIMLSMSLSFISA